MADRGVQDKDFGLRGRAWLGATQSQRLDEQLADLQGFLKTGVACGLDARWCSHHPKQTIGAH